MLLREDTLTGIETLTESSDGDKKMYLEGVFMTAEKKNKNHRIYPKSIMEQAVDKYIAEYVLPKKAIGELGHPDRLQPELTEAAILIESLSWKGDDVIGKAVVLNTPKGKIIQALLEGGYQAGVSSRGNGSVIQKENTSYVKDFELFAIDFVDNPSAVNATPSVIKESEDLASALNDFLSLIKQL